MYCKSLRDFNLVHYFVPKMKKQLLTISTILTVFTLKAQNKILTAKDYERAEQFLSYNIEPLVGGTAVYPNWTSGERFRYLANTKNGKEFLLVDPAKKSKVAAFDHQKLADALNQATGKKIRALCLTFPNRQFC